MHVLVMLLQGAFGAKSLVANVATDLMLCSLMLVSSTLGRECTIAVSALVLWVLRSLMLISSLFSRERAVTVSALVIWVLRFLVLVSSFFSLESTVAIAAQVLPWWVLRFLMLVPSLVSLERTVAVSALKLWRVLRLGVLDEQFRGRITSNT